MKKQEKTLVGLTAHVTLKSNSHEKKLVGKIDTGATRSSIDKNLVRELNLRKPHKMKMIKSASGSSKRPIVYCSIMIGHRKMKVTFSVADRSHMKYRLLIGQNILKKGFLIDPSKK